MEDLPALLEQETTVIKLLPQQFQDIETPVDSRHLLLQKLPFFKGDLVTFSTSWTVLLILRYPSISL